MTPSLDDLAVFVAVAETAGISAAAARLEIPKSSVSRALARLEAAVGAQLVYRTTRRLSLSSAGAALLARTAPLVSALGETVSTLPDRGEAPAGRLRVTCTIDFGAAVLADVATRFTARYPAVEVEVHLTNAVVDLVRHGFDLAVRFSPKRRLRDSALVAQRIGTLETNLVASPKYLAPRAPPRSPRDLAEHDWVTYTGGESIVLEAPKARGERRFDARGRIKCDDMFFARAALRAGAGIGILPSFLAHEDIASGALVQVLPRWSVVSGLIWLVHPAGRAPPPKVTAFRELMVEALSTGTFSRGARALY